MKCRECWDEMDDEEAQRAEEDQSGECDSCHKHRLDDEREREWS